MRVTANGTSVFDGGTFAAGGYPASPTGVKSDGFVKFKVTPGSWTFMATAK